MSAAYIGSAGAGMFETKSLRPTSWSVSCAGFEVNVKNHCRLGLAAFE